MNTFIGFAILGLLSFNFLLLSGVYGLLKLILIRHREVEARVEMVMLETMFLKEQP